MVQMLHFPAASLQCCPQDVAQMLHMSPESPCQAGSELTGVGKMAQLGFKAFFPLHFFPISISSNAIPQQVCPDVLP